MEVILSDSKYQKTGQLWKVVRPGAKQLFINAKSPEKLFIAA